MNNERKIIDSVETLESALTSLKEAEKKFSTYTQEQVDKIFLAAASAANKARIPLAKMAVEETGMGVGQSYGEAAGHGAICGSTY